LSLMKWRSFRVVRLTEAMRIVKSASADIKRLETARQESAAKQGSPNEAKEAPLGDRATMALRTARPKDGQS
jgi:hypothetical protein